MLWSVQDGAQRMNPCGIKPSDKVSVLDSAIRKGLSLGMKYFEIYQQDMQDSALNNDLLKLHEYVSGTKTGVNSKLLNAANYQYELKQNYPNPYNPDTRISFYIFKPGIVSLDIYNVLGKKILNAVHEYKNTGNYTYKFDAGNHSLSSGVYYYKLLINNYCEIKKMVFIK
jgi:hypothetical protein